MFKKLSLYLLVATFIGFVAQVQAQTCTGDLTVTLTGSASGTALAAPTGTASQTFCQGATVANLTATPITGATIAWYSAASGGTALTSGTVLATGNYYAAQILTSTSCESVSRFAVAVTVTPANTAGAASSSPTLCINTALTAITHATTGATGIASINIDFNGASGSALGLPINTTPTQVAQVQFTVDDASLPISILTHATYCVVYKDAAPNPILLNLDTGCPTLTLDWLDFQAQATTDKGIKSVNLDWVTADEQHVQHFVMERSRDGKTFEKIGAVVAPHNTSAKHSYHGVDAQPWSGVSFYRIREVAVSGEISFSPIRTVSLSNEKTIFSVHPNPKAKESPLSIQTNWTENYVFNVYDAMGKLIYSRTCKGTVEMDNLNLVGGFYLYECLTPQDRTTGKLIVPN
jgi:hypothetical protein